MPGEALGVGCADRAHAHGPEAGSTGPDVEPEAPSSAEEPPAETQLPRGAMKLPAQENPYPRGMGGRVYPTRHLDAFDRAMGGAHEPLPGPRPAWLDYQPPAPEKLSAAEEAELLAGWQRRLERERQRLAREEAQADADDGVERLGARELADRHASATGGRR